MDSGQLVDNPSYLTLTRNPLKLCMVKGFSKPRISTDPNVPTRNQLLIFLQVFWHELLHGFAKLPEIVLLDGRWDWNIEPTNQTHPRSPTVCQCWIWKILNKNSPPYFYYDKMLALTGKIFQQRPRVHQGFIRGCHGCRLAKPEAVFFLFLFFSNVQWSMGQYLPYRLPPHHFRCHNMNGQSCSSCAVTWAAGAEKKQAELPFKPDHSHYHQFFDWPSWNISRSHISKGHLVLQVTLFRS